MDGEPKIAVLADEDVEEDPDRWCSYTECGQELWQIACQPCPFRDGCGTCASAWDRRCRESRCARSSGPLPKKLLLSSSLKKPHRKSMARGSGLRRSDELRGVSGQRTLWCKRTGSCAGKPGASLWLSEVRQENAFTQRAVYLAYQTDCLPCALREQCLAPGAKGNRARRVSAVRHLLPPPASVERKPVLLGPMRWVDVAGRALRRRWMARLSSAICRGASPGSKPAGGKTSCASTPRPSFAPELPLARSARTQRLVGTPAMAYHRRRRSHFSRHELTQEELATKEAFLMLCPLPLSGSAGQRIPVCFRQPPSLPPRLSGDTAAVPFVPKPYME
jgi:hypothetical protein